MLRQLKMVDAPLMLEWMHDKDVVENLKKDFHNMTIAECENFIKKNSMRKLFTDEIHLAIVDSNDEYLGTVSLKEINTKLKNAEFGITVRKKAMGKGIAIEAMREILSIGLKELNLNCIYWCVSPKNTRAINFYQKNNFNRIDSNYSDFIKNYTKEEIESYIWYFISK
ncbi:GNAT family N-acetyltransferase [Clostridium sp. SM-530-WT-3G]|uniref:GNAT family N-acetyltransferase n=1 Tax=Clostridium sp. SM-530-WT-3G TaxID=2725303 RepID=UPI00145C804F|nr:GNAT family N-acetyltransferase [Clostridium sp. SM-530-WT-3G]